MVYEILYWIESHKKLLVRLAIAALLLLIAWSIYSWIDRRGKVGVDVDVFPSNARVEIKNHGSVGRGVTYLAPGTYEYTISSDGYQLRSGTVYVGGKTPTHIYASLIDEDGDYTEGEQRRIRQIEAKGGKASYQYTQNFRERYPIINYLPVKDAYYQIGYLVNDKGEDFHLTVYTESPLYRNLAIKRIRSLGENPSNYKIVFKDYKNPITGGNQ
jgi:hypothetical protein